MHTQDYYYWYPGVKAPGLRLNIKTVLSTYMAISMLKIRRPLGRLIFNMGIAIPGKTVFLIETAPRTSVRTVWSMHPAVSISIHNAD